MSKALIALLGALMLAAIGLGTYQGMQERAVIANSWSNDLFLFSATGITNNTLQVTPEVGADKAPLACGLIVSSIVADPRLSHEIAGNGFHTIQCGVSSAPLN